LADGLPRPFQLTPSSPLRHSFAFNPPLLDPPITPCLGLPYLFTLRYYFVLYCVGLPCLASICFVLPRHDLPFLVTASLFSSVPSSPLSFSFPLSFFFPAWIRLGQPGQPKGGSRGGGRAIADPARARRIRGCTKQKRGEIRKVRPQIKVPMQAHGYPYATRPPKSHGERSSPTCPNREPVG